MADEGRFTRALGSCLDGFLRQRIELERQVLEARRQMARLKRRVVELAGREECQDVTLVVLQYVAEYLERCVIFLVRRNDLLALGTFGIDESQSGLSKAIVKIDLSASTTPVFADVIARGCLFLGRIDDEHLFQRLYSRIGAPANPEVVLLPLKIGDRTIALIYGDFGAGPASVVHTDALEILAHNAGLALELELMKRDRGAVELAS